MMRVRLTLDRWLGAGIFLLSLAVYSTTVCPTVSFTDNGELAAVAATLGIAHPTGYPLFTVLGRVAAMIPAGLPMIAKLNLAAAFYTACAAVLFFQLALVSRRAVRLFGGREPRGYAHQAGAFAGAAAFAFAETVWSQAVAWEVYGLHLVLILASTMMLVQGIEDILRSPGTLSRRMILASFLLGLSFANHMATILLLPAFVYLYFSAFGWSGVSRRRLLMLLPWSVLALTLYLYLVVRAASHPPLNWGEPGTIERLLRHISGSQYRVWMFSGAGVMRKQLVYFFSHFTSEFHLVLLPLILLGIIVSARRSRRFIVFLGVLGISTLAYASNYDIFDIDSYFLLAYVVSAWFLANAGEWVIERISPARVQIGVACAGCMIVAALQVNAHHRTVDQSDNRMVEDAAANVRDAIAPGGMFVTSQWDYVVSPLLYDQIVERKRTDIRIVDKNLLMNRPWYFTQLENAYPGIFDSVRAERDAFLEQLLRFERGEDFNPTVIQVRWDVFLRAFLRSALAERPLYAEWRILGELPPVGTALPSGIIARIASGPMPKDLSPVPVYRPWPEENILTRNLKAMYLEGIARQGQWLLQNGLPEEARKWQEIALQIDPQNPLIRTVFPEARR